MTTLDDLSAQVGPQLFAEAQRWAWETAASTGENRWDERREKLADVTYDLADTIWYESDLSPTERVVLHFELYRAMPCYGNFMYADVDGLDAEALDLFWLQIRDLISHTDERLAAPIAYWLWCGPFEGEPAKSAEAWRRTVSGAGIADRGLERALEVAGPVPWQIKVATLGELLPDRRWHQAIFNCIRGSVFDAFGDVDVGEASTMLFQLELSPDAADESSHVREALAGRQR